MQFNISNLTWAVQRALNYNIIGKIRTVSYEVISEDTYNLKVIVDACLTEDERDIIYSIDGEISGDFDSIINSNLRIIVDGKTNINELANLKNLAFARYEVL